MRRTDQRRAATFASYQRDVTGREQPDEALPPFARELVEGVEENREELDRLIAENAVGWELDRIAPLERAIMRIALLEMLHSDIAPSDTPIPPEGAIDEAVETAKKFCGADAPGFVNGILSAALRENVPR